MTAKPTENFTLLFGLARAGDRAAANLVYELAFPRLREIAAALLRRHRFHLTLQPTALVGELCLKFGGFNLRIAGREHFFRTAARAMRQVLADRGERSARRRTKAAILWETLAARRPPIDGEMAEVVSDGLARFEKIDSRAAKVLRLRYLEGRQWKEIARALGREEWRVRDDAAFALGWMRDNLT